MSRRPGARGGPAQAAATFQRTYPSEPFLAALSQALTYGLYDLTRLESLILKQVRGAFFQLPQGD